MIGALLRVPFQETVRRVHAALNDAGFNDLRPAHLTVFQHLDPEGTRQVDLAERAQMTKQSMGYLVDYLIRHGYAELEPDPRDRRASLVRLTARGKAVDATARQALGALESRWESLLGQGPFRELKDALERISREIEATGSHAP
jgi:DNA-binding MarR family transcriptional regulator